MVEMKQPNIFMIYGNHKGRTQANLAINKFKQVVEKNNLVYEDLISIIERGVKIDWKDVPSLEELRIFIQKQDKSDKESLKKLKNQDKELSGISDEQKNFYHKLIEFLVENGCFIDLEDLNPEILLKTIIKFTEIDKLQIVYTEHPDYLLGVCNLRDNKIIQKIICLSKIYPKKSFIIVRGTQHQNMTNLLRDKRYVVNDYFY